MNDEYRLRELRAAADRYVQLQHQSGRERLNPDRMRETAARTLRSDGFVATEDAIDDFVARYRRSWEGIDTRSAVFFRLPDLQLGRDPLTGQPMSRTQEFGASRVIGRSRDEDEAPPAPTYSERFLRRLDYTERTAALDLGEVDDIVALTADERYEMETGQPIGFTPKGRVLERERDAAAREATMTLDLTS